MVHGQTAHTAAPDGAAEREAEAAEDAFAPDAEPVGPERRCIVSGAVRPKEELLRFVVAPDGSIVPDLENTLPGRGLWLSARRDMIETAVAKKAFARAARRKVEVAPDLPARVEALMRRRCLDLVGLARRAGAAVSGYEKVRTQLKEDQPGAVLLLAASDGAADGRDKIRALAPALPVIDLFTGAELGAALGRDIAVHVVVTRGTRGSQAGLARRLKEASRRLAEYQQPAAAGPT